jgi:hypothetical protein
LRAGIDGTIPTKTQEAIAEHGLRRSNADKRRSVELALAEWPKLSDVEIGRICAVGKTLAGEVRRDIQPVEKTGSETRIGADGKERRMPARARAALTT